MLLLAATMQPRTEEATGQVPDTAHHTAEATGQVLDTAHHTAEATAPVPDMAYHTAVRKWRTRRDRNAPSHRHDRCLRNLPRWGRTVTGTTWGVQMRRVVTG